MLSANFSLTVVVITLKQPFYRSLEKDSPPDVPLNRAGKMLQAALDVRSPGTPRNNIKNKRSLSHSSAEISSSPESPFKRRNSQSPCEGLFIFARYYLLVLITIITGINNYNAPWNYSKEHCKLKTGLPRSQLYCTV